MTNEDKNFVKEELSRMHLYLQAYPDSQWARDCIDILYRLLFKETYIAMAHEPMDITSGEFS